MSDDRISDSPNALHCPVCATGFTTTPGASCPACGRAFSSQSAFSFPDLRRHSLNAKSYRLQGLGMVAVGIVSLVGVAAIVCLVDDVLGILILSGIILLPAAVRTIRLGMIPQTHATHSRLYYILWSLLASAGVSGLAGLASVVAFCCVCIGFEGHNLLLSMIGLALGSSVGVAVFFTIFIKLWPRYRGDDFPNSPDPEN